MTIQSHNRFPHDRERAVERSGQRPESPRLPESGNVISHSVKSIESPTIATT